MAPAKKPWFRFYVEAVNDPKLRRLKAEHRWLFVACLAAARQSPEPGWLLVTSDQPMGQLELCDWAALKPRVVEQGTDALIGAGVLGFDPDRQAWFVPKWADRQWESDSSAERTSKWRRKNGDVTVFVTPPENRGQITESEPPPSASEEPPAAPESGGGVDQVLNEAARLLAEREADRRGTEIGNRAGYVSARFEPIRAEHEWIWRQQLTTVPILTAQQLAAGKPREIDKGVQAMRTNIERNTRRARGEVVCEDCEDTGWVYDSDLEAAAVCACQARKAS